jgi:two-component system response regulator GlrR
MVPLHLLVTDDDLDKRMLLSRALAREFPHASIFECHSGQEALEYFAANHVDAIITDHNMQPVDGIALIRELRRQGATLPIIMVSGHDEVADQAKAAGVDLFLGTLDLVRIGKPIATFLRERGLDDRKESSAR